MEYRLNTAKQLLDDTKMSITDISYHCGFSSNAYFGKIFREKYGMTPLQYRNRNIDKQDTWCLGSQYWARTPHVQNYNARYY